MIKIAPSLLEADYNCLRDQLWKLEKAGAAYVHLDVMDGNFVPNLSFGMKMIQSIRPSSKLTFDVHMMVCEPLRFAHRMKEAGADVLTVHYEACHDVKETLRAIRILGMKTGVVLKPGTPVEVLDEEIFALSDVIQLMTVEPGLEGQSFLPVSLERIAKVKNMAGKYGRDLDIEVDGDISVKNIREVVRAGANILVSGKAAFTGDMEANIREMKNLAQETLCAET